MRALRRPLSIDISRHELMNTFILVLDPLAASDGLDMAGVPIDRNAVLEYLGRCLFLRMEHLDPAIGAGTWDELSNRRKSFYILVVESLLFEEEAAVRRFLNSNDGIPIRTL